MGGVEPLGRDPDVAEFNEAAAKALTSVELVEQVATKVLAPMDADAASIGVLCEDDSWIDVWTVGFPDMTVQRYRQVPVDAPLPGAAAIRDGSERWYESAAAAFAEFPETADILADTGYERAAVLPLEDERSTFGYLLVHARGCRPWSEREQRRLRPLRDVCAAAAARTRRSDRDHAALIRAEGLQRLTAEFSVVRYPQEVADALVAHGVTAMRAQAGAVHLLDHTGTTLRLVGSRGWPADETARFAEF